METSSHLCVQYKYLSGSPSPQGFIVKAEDEIFTIKNNICSYHFSAFIPPGFNDPLGDIGSIISLDMSETASMAGDEAPPIVKPIAPIGVEHVALKSQDFQV